MIIHYHILQAHWQKIPSQLSFVYSLFYLFLDGHINTYKHSTLWNRT